VLRLDGAATFKVDPTPVLAFDLRTANAAITATGTLFTVRAYPSESVVTIRVTEGSVSVKSSKETRSLTAGGVLAVEKDGTMRVPDSAAVEESLGWTSGYLTIRSQPLGQVLQAFDLWYGVHLVPTDSAILTRTVSMHASLDSVSKAIAAVESSANVKFAYDGPRLILSDRAATKKK
jgi:transmembrane sensor